MNRTAPHEACGWYLCAALHADPLETWLARRHVGVDQDRRREHVAPPLTATPATVANVDSNLAP